MHCSLANHTHGYQMGYKDYAISLLTGFSGLSFAQRHQEMVQIEGESYWRHRALQIVEMVPLLGGVVAIIEWVAHSFFSPIYPLPPWRQAPLNPEEARKKMLEASYEAVDTHNASGYACSSDLRIKEWKTAPPLTFTHQVCSVKGPRPAMEDAHFYLDKEEGVLAGVFDGHGGAGVSKFAADKFPKHFFHLLKKNGRNVHDAFEKTIHRIHLDVVAKAGWNGQGSTAIVCYIDKKTRLIYTATVGDSEANIYRDCGWISSNFKSIPLSVVVDWTSPSERERLDWIYGKEIVEKRLELVRGDPKQLRSRVDEGVNVSRSIGDVNNVGRVGVPLVIHKPKITVSSVEEGDRLILACDGVKDFVREDQIVSIIARGHDPKNIVKEALSKMDDNGPNDNVTLIAIDIT